MFASIRARTATVLVLSVPAVADAATIALAWNANPEINLAGYFVVATPLMFVFFMRCAFLRTGCGP